MSLQQFKTLTYKSIRESGVTFGDGVLIPSLTTAQASAASPSTGDYAYDNERELVLMGGSDSAYHPVTQPPVWTKTFGSPLSVASVAYASASSPTYSYQIPTDVTGNTGFRCVLPQGWCWYTVYGEFDANSSGSYRAIGLIEDDSGGTPRIFGLQYNAPRLSGTTKVCASGVLESREEKSIHATRYISIVAIQDSGSTLNVSNLRVTIQALGSAPSPQHGI